MAAPHSCCCETASRGTADGVKEPFLVASAAMALGPAVLPTFALSVARDPVRSPACHVAHAPPGVRVLRI